MRVMMVVVDTRSMPMHANPRAPARRQAARRWRPTRAAKDLVLFHDAKAATPRGAGPCDLVERLRVVLVDITRDDERTARRGLVGKTHRHAATGQRDRRNKQRELRDCPYKPARAATHLPTSTFSSRSIFPAYGGRATPVALSRLW